MVTEKAYAKVNLFINVLDAKNNGYHNLKMINAKIDFYDTIRISKIKSAGVALIESNDLFLSNQNNIVQDIAEYMVEHYLPDEGIKIEIEKKIPFGAGLAGNSTDAAAIIRGVDKLLELHLSFTEMVEIGMKYGADIPYCLVDYPAIVEGEGEKITKIDFNFSGCQLLLLNPRVYVATKDIFTIGNRKGFDNSDDQKIMKAIAKKDINKFAEAMHNALQKISVENNSDVAEAEKTLTKNFGTTGLVMTGSGSTFIKLLTGENQNVEDFMAKYKKKYFVEIYNFL
ncbi:MAG TPA: 4-(cytidine 5'-diphospho)-2-C-methyl-D-erythritol kinase [Bacillota bacterium]|nr:4-(cytidine 5'-diphospho)-2-C-methyl-D-erythritol kinase [Bacillota bacterium]HPF42860.1 4-(cytidine 5'-diphospho)-2-C-methyl-D-erythritol kinase [Bacillota bacterium]HPJ86280.1 4-(cytidine 5'-diphospho)-2-C-methyl-D-erythritol kinase [Bacillota bacterium]